jgi:hypothetical protein
VTKLVDGVHRIEFCGARAWKIIHKGEEIQMYFGRRSEATQMLWMLRNPVKAHAMLDADLMKSDTRWSERFRKLKHERKGC